jgi:hypothetical protein
MCGTPARGARCPEHARPRQLADAKRRNAKTVAHGTKRAPFQRLRKQRLELAGGYCELRVDAGCTLAATSVHLDPSLGGNHDIATIDDVRAACAHCHGVIDGARASRGRRARP